MRSQQAVCREDVSACEVACDKTVTFADGTSAPVLVSLVTEINPSCAYLQVSLLVVAFAEYSDLL